jgi:hypothetical protein
VLKILYLRVNFKNTILHFLLLAIINLLFCAPQQNDFVAYFSFQKTEIICADQPEGDIQSVFELICEAFFNADIHLPLDEEAALLEKDIIGKRISRTFTLFIAGAIKIFSSYQEFITSKYSKLLLYTTKPEALSSGFEFIFRLTPF